MDIGLLLLRLTAGGTMLFAHGLMKMQNFAAISQQFPDFIGIGPAGNLALVVFAELFCAGLVVLGLFTRMALIPLIITMGVAFFVVHGADPFEKKEMAMLFLGMYLTLLFTGPGRYSVQGMFQISAGRFSWLLK